ncbi:MAG TPA: 50S ribosomal protein L32 [Firmicutes bacterium]|nr:50S ribosomal protein L32 [Bacillota bacterium]
MAVPFRRTSKTKKRMRRTHLKKTLPGMTTCPNCGASLKPHRVCTNCGYYKNKEAIQVGASNEEE